MVVRHYPLLLKPQMEKTIVRLLMSRLNTVVQLRVQLAQTALLAVTELATISNSSLENLASKARPSDKNLLRSRETEWSMSWDQQTSNLPITRKRRTTSLKLQLRTYPKRLITTAKVGLSWKQKCKRSSSPSATIQKTIRPPMSAQLWTHRNWLKTLQSNELTI